MIEQEFDFYSVFSVDFETGRLFWKAPPKNHAQRLGDEAGAVNIGAGNNKNYWQVRAFGRTFKRSRVIFYMAHGRWPVPFVDHINGNSLDDCLKNLRECTPALNTVNSAPHARKTALPRGVYQTRQGRFMARICIAGAPKSLGTFDTIEFAQAVYERARKEAFHEFA